MDIARRDHLEYFIEDILGFEGNIECVSTLSFHVKWLGYDESYNLWERWRNLMDTEQLHKYLISVNIRHLIPRKFHLNYLQFNSIHEDFFLIFLPILGFLGSFSH